MMRIRSDNLMVYIMTLMLIINVSPSSTNQCPEKMDVVFLLDHSGSINDRNPTNGSWDNWVLVKNFVVEIVKELDISLDNSHVGVATFGNMAISRIDLNDLYDSSSISNTISNIPPGNGNTNTYAGLKLMREMFRVENGGRYKVPRVGIIITDGKPTINQELTVSEATSLYYARISLYAIGVTDDIDANFLSAISSPPQRIGHNYWLSPDFRSLVNIIRSVQNATCSPDVDFNTTCQTMDLVFATSIPTNKNHLTTLEDLISNTVSLMPIGSGEKDVRVALTTYNLHSSNTIFRLDSHFDKATISSKISSLNVNSGSSFGDPYIALDTIKTEVLTVGQGMRTNSSKVIVLIIWVDQLYNKQSMETEIKGFVERGVRVIIMDVRGKLQKSELQRLVMFPRDVISTSGYTYLKSKVHILAKTLCSINQDVGCRYISEIVLLVDISSRIYQEANYRTLWSTYYQGFLLNFVQAFNIALSKTRIAIVTYNSSPSVVATLTSSSSLIVLENVISTIQPTTDNNVNLASALRTARSTFSASRAGVKKIVLLLNYKYPTIEVDRVSLEATFIKEQADIITVGIIPPRNKDESITLLKDIATSPTTHYHSALDFTHLNDFLYDIINDVCLISTAPVITTTTTTTTTTTITTTTPIKPSNCRQSADVLFLIDTTLNVNNNYYTTLYLPMIQSIVGKLDVDNGVTRVAAVAFADAANVIFNFNTYNTASAVTSALAAFPHRGYYTNLQNAISLAHNQAFTAAYGARVNDNSVSKVMVILTSNPSKNAQGTISEAQQARNKGIYIVTIGIGTYLNLHELSSIATYPSTNSMFVVDTARKMPTLVDPLTNVICPDTRRLVNRCDPGFAGPLCQECRGGSDIVFILPSSYSIDQQTFMTITSFVGEVIESINVDGPDGSRVGIMVAGETAVVSFNMLKHVSRDGLLQACNVQYAMQKTCNSALALKTVREQMFTPWSGDRVGFSNNVIFLSNGFYDNRTRSWLEAVETRKKGINIIMIGVGPYVKKEDLSMMASSENNVHMMSSWSDLLHPTTLISTKLAPMLCNSLNPCNPNPCRNNAVCSVSAGNAECGACPLGYSGRYCTRACSGLQDVVFLINAASATHRERLKDLTTFATSLVQLINIHPSSTRVALVYWGKTARVLFHLKDYLTRKDVVDAINTTPFIGGQSNTAAALDLVANGVFTVSNGDRPEAQNIVILLTNVNSEVDTDKVIPKAVELRTSGAILMTVGIELPMSTSDELKAISSFPRPSNQFNVNRFSDLPSIVPTVYNALCDKQDSCTSSPCLNGGRCVDGFSNYHCLCAQTYVGKRCENVCQSKLDLALVLDVSGSVVDEYTISVAMARRLAYGLDITSDYTRMASIAFSEYVHNGFDLLKYVGSKTKLLEAFDFSLKVGGKTNIKDAMSYLKTDVFVQSKGDRPWATNVVVLLTDGYANVNDDPPFQGADLLKKAGVEIYVVAIGADVFLGQLGRLASSPEGHYVVRMPPQSDPLETANALLNKLCRR